MTISKINRSGFGIVETLVVVVLVGVFVAAGWFVFQHNRTKSTNASAGISQNKSTTTKNSTNQQSSSTQSTTTTSIIQVPELGISITVPSSIKDLTYKTQTVTLRNGQQGTLALFSTTSLTAADAKCGPSSIAVGSLEHVDGEYPTSSQDQYATLDYGPLVKQFSTFYISGGYQHQAGCSSAASAGSDTAAATNNSNAASDGAAFEASLSTVQQLSSSTTN